VKMTDRSITVIGAPSNLGLRPPAAGRAPGVYRLAQTLRERGLVSRLGATDGGTVTPPPYSPDVDRGTGMLNGDSLRAFSLDLAEKVGPDVQQVRTLDPTEAARRTVEKMEASGVEGFWVHLDADVLDDAIMPAVDSRQPGGLSYNELIELLRPLLDSPLAAGMQVTIFDPELDRDGEIAEQFTDVLVEALSQRPAKG
jgi:Arginase family